MDRENTKKCLSFTNEEIANYLVSPLSNNSKFSLKTEMGAEESAKFSLEIHKSSKSPLYSMDGLSEREKIDKIIEAQSKDNRYFFKGQITGVYFENPDNFEDDENWFCVEFYTEHLAKLYCLNEVFVFMDEELRRDGSSISETYGELVYEGQLHGKTPAEILTVMRELVEILAGAKKLERQNFDMPQRSYINEKQYGYRIDLYYPKGLKPKMSEHVLDNYHFYFHDLP